MVEVNNVIQCQERTRKGKGAARKIRGEGMTPVVAYGPGSEPRHLKLDPYVFGFQRRKYGLSYIYDVDVEGQSSFKAMIKEIQIDPVTDVVQHVDLYAVDMTQAIKIDVPIELTGKPAGAIDGGLLSQVLRRVEVQCLPDLVPTKLTVDVSEMMIGDVIHTDSLPLPAGVEIVSRRTEAVATVVAPEAEEEPVVEEGELAEGEVAAEGEGAPADGEAAPAADGEKKEEEKKDKKDKKDK